MKRERETLIARGLILPAHSPHHHTHRCHQQQQRTRTAVISTRVVVPATGVHQASAQQVVSGAPSTHQDSRPHAPSCSVHTARPQRQQGSGSMSERAQRAAPVPSLAEPGQPLVGSDADFHHLNKQLRACYGCKLIKTMAQFLDTGCENCRWEDVDHSTIHTYTTSNFSGLMTIMDPQHSWVGRWTHTSKSAAGCYALSINDDVPQQEREGRRMR